MIQFDSYVMNIDFKDTNDSIDLKFNEFENMVVNLVEF